MTIVLTPSIIIIYYDYIEEMLEDVRDVTAPPFPPSGDA